MRASIAALLAITTTLAACQQDAQGPTDASASSAAAPVQEELFTLVPAAQATGAAQGRLAGIRGRETAAEVHVARLTDAPGRALQQGRAVRISLSPTRHVVAVGERVAREGAQGGIAFAGSLRNEEGTVEMVVTSAGATGSVWVGETLYRFEPIGEGLHALVKVDRTKLPSEHMPGNRTGTLIQTPGTFTAPSAARLPSGTTGNVGIASTSQLDLLVVYTAAAASATNISNLVSLAVNETNTSYSNSGISASVRSLALSQVTYSEASRTFDQHVAALQGTADGMMDGIHSLRDQYGADVVVLIVNDSEACGIASQIMATASTAFAVVHYDCATGNYSFGHEIGHLQGARHDRFVDPSTTPFAYGHGYIPPTGNWRTIMSYGNGCNNCTRVKYWSNPNVTYPPTGQVMGTAAYEDNARVLNETTATLAGFRTPPPSVYISGPQYISRYQSAQYTAYASDGTPGYTYEWRSRDGLGWNFGAWQSWFSTGAQNYTYASVNSCGIDRKELQVRVTDAAAKTGTSTYTIYISNPC